MTQSEINDLLEAAKPSIIEALKKEITAGISYEAKEVVQKEVQAAVTEWVKENIIPAVVEQLVESKDGIISTAVSLAPMMVDEINKGLISALSEKMKSSWERKKIFDSMFS
jgi:Ni,Fe-hydrogenase III component G